MSLILDERRDSLGSGCTRARHNAFGLFSRVHFSDGFFFLFGGGKGSRDLFFQREISPHGLGGSIGSLNRHALSMKTKGARAFSVHPLPRHFDRIFVFLGGYPT